MSSKLLVRSTKSPTQSVYRRMRRDPSSFIAAIVLGIILLTFVLWPVFGLLAEPDAGDWRQLWTSDRLRGVARNTAMMVLLSTVSATLVGFAFAYGLTRPDLPAKRFFRVVSLLPLVSPPFVIGLALILLFGRRGVITYELLGLNLDVYGLTGLWIVQTFTFYPVAVLALVGVLRNQSPAMEWAARDLGHSWFSIMRTITMPLALPGLLSAALLVGMFVLADFGNPLLIAGDFRVVAVEAFLQVTGRFNMGLAAALAVLLLIPAILFFLLQRWILSKKSYVTVTGKESSLDPVPTPPAVRAVLVAIMSATSVFIIVTYASVIWGGFTQAWGVNWSFTLDHMEFVLFRTGDLRNSVTYAMIAGVVTGFFAVTAGFFLHRRSVPGRAGLDALCVLPAALPGTMMGIAWLVTFNTGPLVLTGTAFIIIMSMIIRNVPVGYRSGVASMQQISKTIDEASSDLGAGPLQTFGRVLFPLVKSAFTAALVYAFVKSVNTLSAVIFLVSPGHQLAPVSIMGLAEHGYWGQATALSAALMLCTFVVLGLFKLFTRNRLRLFEL